VHPQAEPEAAPSPAGYERGKPEILAPRVLGDRAVIAAEASSAVGYVALRDRPAVGSGRAWAGVVPSAHRGAAAMTKDVPTTETREGGRATLGATRMNDCPVLRTCLENRPEHVRGHGLI
jgi:hypothetical protein